MPASPRDFLLYSRMTGKPMPENAMERMRMAPEVYQFTKNFAKKPNLLEKTGNLARSIGRGAVMAIGAPMVAEAVAAEADRKEKVDVTGDVQPEMEVINQPVSEAMQIEQEKTKRKQIEIEGRKDLQRMANTGVQKGDLNTDFTFVGKQEDTTADNFEQDVVPQQTTDEVAQRSATQQAELETNQTIADNAAASQDFTPKKSVEEIEADLARDMEIAGRTRIGGPANVTEAVDKFLGQPGLDPILLAAMNARGQQEELAGTSFPIASPLSDNPQTPPGQTNSAVSQPFAENIEPITNPSPNLTPQMQSILNTLAQGRADLSQGQRMDIARQMVSPNELAGKDQATFEALTGSPSQQQLIDASKARSRVEQKTAAQQRRSGIQSRMTDQYYPSGVARTDIQVGGMKDRKTGLGKSVGISYTPLNGDTKVGFNIMSDPTKPQDVSTFDFVASPKTMESLESQQEGDLGALAFGKLFNIAKQKKQGFSGMEM
tara:strand:+ start:7520 stop:8986 length:1467 start_codon:yes stop_codon:yes gene_type:complete